MHIHAQKRHRELVKWSPASTWAMVPADLWGRWRVQGCGGPCRFWPLWPEAEARGTSWNQKGMERRVGRLHIPSLSLGLPKL